MSISTKEKVEKSKKIIKEQHDIIEQIEVNGPFYKEV